MSSKNFDQGFRVTVSEANSPSKFQKKINNSFENDLNEFKKLTQDVNAKLSLIEHDNFKNCYQPKYNQSSASEIMECKLQQSRRKNNLTKTLTLNESVGNYLNTQESNKWSFDSKLESDQAPLSTIKSTRSQTEDSKKLQNIIQMNDLLPKIREKSSSDEHLQSKSVLEKYVKNKPPIDLREFKKFLKTSIYEKENMNEEKKKIKKNNKDNDDNDDDERDSGYDLTEIKNGLTMSETDLLSDRFRTTSAPELSENNLMGRTFSRNSLASTNRQLSSEFEESAWGSQELESDHDQDFYQKDKSIEIYKDLNSDRFVFNNTKKKENQNIVQLKSNKEKEESELFKFKQTLFKKQEVEKKSDEIMDGIMKNSFDKKKKPDYFNDDDDDKKQDSKDITSLMDTKEKEEKDDKNLKKTFYSFSQPLANRWSDPLGHWSLQQKKQKNENKQISDSIHSQESLNFLRSDYQTPSVTDLKAHYEKETNRWPHEDTQEIPFGKVISKRLKKLSSNQNLDDQLNVNKKISSVGIQVSSLLRDATFNTEIDMPIMNNILDKLMTKKYSSYTQTDPEEKANLIKRDIAVGTEKFSRERFSTLPETKSKSTQTDLCQTRSKSIAISTDDTSLENLAIKRQRYRWTKEASVHKPTKMVQTDPIIKQDAAVEIKNFSDSDHEKEFDKSNIAPILPLKYSPVESETSDDFEEEDKMSKLILSHIKPQNEKKSKDELSKIEETKKEMKIIDQGNHDIKDQSLALPEIIEKDSQVLRKENIEKALMNIIMQSEDDVVKNDEGAKKSLEKYDPVYQIEKPKTDHNESMILEKSTDEKNFKKETKLQSCMKNINTKSTILVSIQKSDKSEISEINSFTTLDLNGKLLRKTQITTTKKIPVLKKNLVSLQNSPQLVTSQDLSKNLIFSESKTKNSESIPVRSLHYNHKNNSMRPASAIDFSYSTSLPARPISSMVSAFSENEIDMTSKPANVMINQLVPTSKISSKEQSTRAKSLNTSPIDNPLVSPNQSFKKHNIKDEVIWTETSSSTICNEMASDPYKDSSGQIHKPKSVFMTSETVIQSKEKDSKIETKSKAARKYADESIKEPDITSEAFLSDSTPVEKKEMPPKLEKLNKVFKSEEKFEKPVFSSPYLTRLEDNSSITSTQMCSSHLSPFLSSSDSSHSKSKISSRIESNPKILSSPENNEFSFSRESPPDSRFKTNDLKKYTSTPNLEFTSSLQQDEADVISKTTSDKKLESKPNITDDFEPNGTEIVTRIIKITHPEKDENDEKKNMKKKKNSISKMILEQELQSGVGIKNKNSCKIFSSVTFESPFKSNSFSTSQINKGLIIKEIKNADYESTNQLKNSSSYDSLIKPKTSEHIYIQPNREVITTTKFERYNPLVVEKEKGKEETVWKYSMECKCINGLNTSVRTSVSHKRTYLPLSLTLYESSV